MISNIRGNIIHKTISSVIVNVGGVGFEVIIPTNSLPILPGENSEINLYTYLYVREDEMKLFGFVSSVEKLIFQLLLKVNGVGPKLAMQALSVLTSDEIIYALTHEKFDMLTKIPGVGSKLAQRLVLELNKEASKLELESPSIIANDKQSEATQALILLGFPVDKIKSVVSEIIKTDNQIKSEDIIRIALKRLTL